MFPKAEVDFVCSVEPKADKGFAVDPLLVEVVEPNAEVGCVVGLLLVVPNADVDFTVDWMFAEGVEPKAEVVLAESPVGALVFPNANGELAGVELDAGGWALAAAGEAKPPMRPSKGFELEAGLTGSSFF